MKEKITANLDIFLIFFFFYHVKDSMWEHNDQSLIQNLKGGYPLISFYKIK